MKLFYALTSVLFFFVIAGCSQQEIEPENQEIVAQDQELMSSSIEIERVVSSQDGWIVIHRDIDGNLGEVIGYARVSKGKNENVIIDINTNLTTSAVYAMLHMDVGNMGVYEFPGDDIPVTLNDDFVIERIELINFEE